MPVNTIVRTCIGVALMHAAASGQHAFTVDADFNITYMNAAAEEIVGIGRDEGA